MSDTVTDLIMARVTGEEWTGRYTGDRRYPTKDEVAQRAYRLYEARGRVDGHDIEDWLLAEKELTRPYAFPALQTAVQRTSWTQYPP